MPRRLLPDLAALHALLAPDRQTEIVDIGANPINPAPYDGLVDGGLARVTGFEPQQEAYAALKMRESAHRRFLPYAIGDGGVQTLRLCRGPGFTSLLEPSRAFLDYVDHFRFKMQVTDRVEIETRRLDDIAELPAPDLIKIDIQGAEPMVFDNAPRALANAVAVITETAFIELYEGQPLFDAQMRLLRAHGFVLHKILDHLAVPLRGRLQAGVGVEPLRNQWVDGDAVFIRPVPPDTGLGTEPLKRLALLAAGAFHSLDVALRCLDILIGRGAVDAGAAEAWADGLRAGPTG